MINRAQRNRAKRPCSWASFHGALEMEILHYSHFHTIILHNMSFDKSFSEANRPENTHHPNRLHNLAHIMINHRKNVDPPKKFPKKWESTSGALVRRVVPFSVPISSFGVKSTVCFVFWEAITPGR